MTAKRGVHDYRLVLADSTRSSAVAKRPRDASCLYSFNTKRRVQSIIVSASDIPLGTIKFFYVVFSSAYCPCYRPSQTNIRWYVAECACDLHCMVVGNCFCHFVVRTSSNRLIASGAWPTVSYTQLRRR